MLYHKFADGPFAGQSFSIEELNADPDLVRSIPWEEHTNEGAAEEGENEIVTWTWTGSSSEGTPTVAPIESNKGDEKVAQIDAQPVSSAAGSDLSNLTGEDYANFRKAAGISIARMNELLPNGKSSTTWRIEHGRGKPEECAAFMEIIESGRR